MTPLVLIFIVLIVVGLAFMFFGPKDSRLLICVLALYVLLQLTRGLR